MKFAIDREELAKALCDRFPLGVPYTAYREDADAIIAALERAPQAQEEPSGAPAPALDGRTAFQQGLYAKQAPAGYTDIGPGAQPPAPASPAWLVWTKEKPTRDGWYWLRLPGATAQCEFIVRDHENGVSRWINELSGEWEPVLDGREWAGPIPEPSAPEAGAPGTQTRDGGAHG